MDFEAVKAWYEESVRRKIRNGRIVGVLGFVLMPLALAAGAALVYGLVYSIGRRTDSPFSSATCLWVSIAFIPFMFFGNLCTPRRDLMEERMREGAPTTGSPVARGQVYLQVILWILFAGPRLVDWSLASLKENKRLKTQDRHSCAAVLWMLLTHYKKVPYDDIPGALPWVDMNTTIPQVLAIPGVVGLNTAPAGMSLTQDMRDLMRAGKHE